MVSLIPRRWAALLAVVLMAVQAHAQPVTPETQIKAAFLYKFGAFVEWPAGTFSGAPGAFVIGIVGAAALAEELERQVRGRTIYERRVEVRRLSPADEGIAQAHVLFVGDDASAQLGEIAAALQGRPVLLVTESESALAHGSMINFVTEANRVRFDVALPPAERGRLSISSRLLMVARKVVTHRS